MTQWTSAYDAAARLVDELTDARRRLDAGEAFNTTAAELGFTPFELRELLDAQQTQERESAQRQRWAAIYDNDQQDLY